MWFIFPQHRDLGRSATAKFYGLSGEEEARAYLGHPLLGPRYRECVAAARAQLAEFGVVIAPGPRNTLNALQRLNEDEAMARLPELLRSILQVFAA